jgi:hypothetical protein
VANDGRLYDTQQLFIAQDAQTDPSFLPPYYVADSVNRSYRGGRNKTRPPWIERKILVNTDDPTPEDTLNLIQRGNFQGCKEYRAVKPGSFDGWVASIAGNIFFFAAQGNYFVAYKIWSENDKYLLHSWFVQAEDQFYIQNGKDQPLVWDGLIANQCVQLNPYLLEMPIGTIMAYAHGRVHVATIYDQIYSSDNIFGAGFTTTTNTRNFTEQIYWNEGGAFSLLANMGRIFGMLVLPSININSRGQGELVVFSQAGATSFDVSGPRTTWGTTNIQKLTLVGRGCASSWSLTTINGQVFYRSFDGWSFFSNSQSEFQTSLTYRNISAEVEPYTKGDAADLIQFESATYFDNRIIAMCAPYLSQGDEGFGLHRMARAFVVADVNQTASSAPDSSIGFRWNGLWTGPRPCQIWTMFVGTEEHCFTFSHDDDGKNRIYELTRNGVDDFVDGENHKIRSYFSTRRFDWSSSGQTNKDYRKKINGGDMWLSDFSQAITVMVQYRPDAYQCWHDLYEDTFYCDNCPPKLENQCEPIVSQNQMRRITFESPESGCQENQDIKTDHGAEFQLKVELIGNVEVSRLRLSIAKPENADAPFGSCNDTFGCKPITCCQDNLFDYGTILS